MQRTAVRWQRRVMWFALAVLETAGLLWVLYSGLPTAEILQADGFPSCGLDPDKRLLLVLWLAGLTFAALSFVAALRGQLMAAVLLLGAEAVAGYTWIGLGGFTASACLHT